jgi:hypothetical protein
VENGIKTTMIENWGLSDSKMKTDYINAIRNRYQDTELVQQAKKEMQSLSIEVILYLHARLTDVNK